MDEMQMYWSAVRSTVCAHCIDSDGNANCRLEPGMDCALRVHFPAVVDVVLSTSGDSLLPYMKALRERICTVCENQGTNGACKVRDEIACGLDRHFPLVVDAIEQAMEPFSGSAA